MVPFPIRSTPMAAAGAEEASPLLPATNHCDAAAAAAAAEKAAAFAADDPKKGLADWTADGLPVPLAHAHVLASPAARAPWDSSLCACLGRNDEFCSSDLEVCLLGSFVPCVLYGSNAERLGAGPGSFANNCLPYTGLYMLGNSLFGWNCLAPWISYPARTAMRRKFNLEGSCEAFSRSCGCCGGVLQDEVKREQLESVCDLATHFFCHPCALCQEGRELRRRLPHPGFNARPVMLMMPPSEQTMGRGA